MFNTLVYAKRLEEAGVSREQAEIHVQIIADIVEGDLATKQDIQSLRAETRIAFQASSSEARQEFQNLRSETWQEFQILRNELNTTAERLEHKMLQLEYRLVIKLGTIVTVCIAAFTAVIKLL